MMGETRFLIDGHIYRIDTVFFQISQVGNANNRISCTELRENKHSYNLSIDRKSGKLLLDNEGGQVKNVLIPKTVLDDGYFECSQYAENFNAKLSEKFGIQLVDKAVLKKMKDLPILIPQQVLPIIEQDGFKFEIDVSLREIHNAESPFEHINLRDLKQENGKYIVYASEEGYLFSWDKGGGTKRFEIDQLVKIAPDDVSKVYGIPKDKLPDTDRQLRTNQEFIQNRIDKGMLPIIRIVDEDYFVDTRLHELRSANKFWKVLDLIDHGPIAPELDNKHVYLYDYLDRQIILGFNSLTEMPKHTVFVVLPDLESLDPVAAGRRLYNDPYALLDKYPLQPFMEARIVPIEKTYLAERIQFNDEKRRIEKSAKEKLMSEKRIVIKPDSNSKVIKPGKKNNRNNGLPF